MGGGGVNSCLLSFTDENNVYDFHIPEQMVKPRKNMSKITKQQEFTAKFGNNFCRSQGGGMVKTVAGS